MDKVEVYHAGTDRIEQPDCLRGRNNLDFGRGFYITDIYEQAYNLALLRSHDRWKPALINTYVLDRNAFIDNTRTLVFDLYDNDWLEFIVACCSGQDVWKSFDYVEGGVADDRVIDTVNMYIQGYISKEKALRNLRFLKPNNQICILNQELLNQHLVFKECLEIPTTNGLL